MCIRKYLTNSSRKSKPSIHHQISSSSLEDHASRFNYSKQRQRYHVARQLLGKYSRVYNAVRITLLIQQGSKDRTNLPYCKEILPLPVTDSNSMKVTVRTLKAKKVRRITPVRHLYQGLTRKFIKKIIRK